MHAPQLVLMAAGVGSRYGGCKQIEGVGPQGEAILEYTVADARAAGFGATVVILREEILDDFRQGVGRRIEAAGEVRYALQRPDRVGRDVAVEVPAGRTKPWGTGHAVLSAAPFVDAPFAVANADDYYGPDAFRKLAAFLRGATEVDRSPLPLCMVAYPLQRTLSENGTVSRGVCAVDPQNHLLGIREAVKIFREGEGIVSEEASERTVLAPGTLVSMNLWGLVPGVFEPLQREFARFLATPDGDPLKKEFYLPDAIGRLLRDGLAEVTVFRSEDAWFGITYPGDRDQVAAALAERGAVR
jgi:hypothetical protein